MAGLLPGQAGDSDPVLFMRWTEVSVREKHLNVTLIQEWLILRVATEQNDVHWSRNKLQNQ